MLQKLTLLLIGLLLLMGMAGESILYLSIFKVVSTDAHPLFSFAVFTLLPLAVILVPAVVYSVVMVVLCLHNKRRGLSEWQNRVLYTNAVYICLYLFYYSLLLLAPHFR